MSPSTVCPMPTAHNYASVKSAYDKARKANPTLSPAAWRKAAAQELGMPYDDYLKLWKTKGKVPGYPASAPTPPAGAAPGAGMGIAPKPASGLSPASKAYVDGLEKLVDKGLVSVTEAISDLGQLLPKANFVNGELQKVQALLNKFKAGTVADEAAAKVAQEAALDVLQTELGPLTHDLAQGIYKQMKTNMPNATPAVWRKAAADYLNVDYKDYLKAWKKPTTAAQKAKTLPKSQWPPVDPPVVPTQIGKYAGQADYNTGDLKTDLARLLGPDGNPAYIIIDRLSGFTGQYTWHIPQSVVKTQAAREAIAEQLKKLGFKVDLDGVKLKFWTQAAEDAAKKASKVTGADSFTQTIVVAGNEVWNTASAAKWSHREWKTLTANQRQVMKSYSGSYYTTINGVLRGQYAGNPTVFSEAKAMSAAMKKVDHGFTVFRGVDFSVSEFKVGSLWTDKGFVSTSIDRNAGFSSHKPTKMIIEVPPGTKGFYIGPNSTHPGELEFIIDSNTKFRVISVQGNTVRLVAVPK